MSETKVSFSPTPSSSSSVDMSTLSPRDQGSELQFTVGVSSLDTPCSQVRSVRTTTRVSFGHTYVSPSAVTPHSDLADVDDEVSRTSHATDLPPYEPVADDSKPELFDNIYLGKTLPII